MENGYCVHCGTALTAEQVACPHCGIGRGIRQQGTGNSPPHVPDYLVWSIVTLCCCNVALGIIALVFSVLSRSDLDAGRYDSAVTNSKVAFWCNVASLAFCGLIYVFIFVILALGLLQG